MRSRTVVAMAIRWGHGGRAGVGVTIGPEHGLQESGRVGVDDVCRSRYDATERRTIGPSHSSCGPPPPPPFVAAAFAAAGVPSELAADLMRDLRAET
eukprot:COSAG01_NODE_30852_length_608_cov_1.188605_1_plen_96_part_10